MAFCKDNQARIPNFPTILHGRRGHRDKILSFPILILLALGLPWIYELCQKTQRATHEDESFRCTISVITFNRLAALKRLIASLQNADYCGENVKLVINIEAGAPEELVVYTQRVHWPHGDKHIRFRTSPSGLVPAVVESWYPSSENEFGLLLEDDIEVSPLFFVWMRHVVRHVKHSNMRKRIFGVSLYTPRITETTNPYMRYLPDVELKKYDSQVYLHQIPCSWGALQFPSHWSFFHKYMHHRLAHNESFNFVPGSRTNGWKGSWKKFYIELAWSKGMVMAYPNYLNQTSFSTNHLEQGVHIHSKGMMHLPIDYTVPLHFSSIKELEKLELFHTPVLDVFNNEYNINSNYVLTAKRHQEDCLGISGYTGNPIGKKGSLPVLGNKLLSGHELTQASQLISTPIRSGKHAGFFFRGFVNFDGVFKIVLHSSDGKAKTAIHTYGVAQKASWEASLHVDNYGALRLMPRSCVSGTLTGFECHAWEVAPPMSKEPSVFSLLLADNGELVLFKGCACSSYSIAWTSNNSTANMSLARCSSSDQHTLSPNNPLSSMKLNTITSVPDTSGKYYEGVMQADGNFVVYLNNPTKMFTPVFETSTHQPYETGCTYKFTLLTNGNLRLTCFVPQSQVSHVLWDNLFHGVALVPHFMRLGPFGSLEIFQGYNMCDRGPQVWRSSGAVLAIADEAGCSSLSESQYNLMCKQCSPDVYRFLTDAGLYTALISTDGADMNRLQQTILQLTLQVDVWSIIIAWQSPQASHLADSFIHGKLIKHLYPLIDMPYTVLIPSQHISTSAVLIIQDQSTGLQLADHDLQELFLLWNHNQDKIAMFSPDPLHTIFLTQHSKQGMPSSVYSGLMMIHKQYIFDVVCGPGLGHYLKRAPSRDPACEFLWLLKFVSRDFLLPPIAVPLHPPEVKYGSLQHLGSMLNASGGLSHCYIH